MGTYRAVKVVYRNHFSEDRPYEREFDGIRRFEPISRSHDGFVSFLELNPRQIEAMEIYRGVATVPPEFSPMPNDCAAVVVSAAEPVSALADSALTSAVCEARDSLNEVILFEIDEAILRIQHSAGACDELEKSTKAIQNHSDKILRKVRSLRKTLEKHVGAGGVAEDPFEF